MHNGSSQKLCKHAVCEVKFIRKNKVVSVGMMENVYDETIST